MEDRILRADDPEVSERLRALLEGEGIRVRLGRRAERVRTGGGEKVVELDDGSTLPGDEIFVATGRRPALDGLGLEEAGVEVRDGAVMVGPTLRTSNRRVWAAGDVTGGLQFTHVADYMAKTVLRNALLPGATRPAYDSVPRVTYTDPELAHVGMTHAEAADRGARVFAYEMDDLDRAIVDGEGRGVVKISADKKGRILAATVLATHAGDLIAPLVLAKTHGLGLAEVNDTIFPYPTMAEGVKRASGEYMRSRLEGRAGSLLKGVISWLK